jgi:sulfur-carrier protein
MQVKVKYFGMVADLLKKSQEEIDVSVDHPIDWRAFFIVRYPQLVTLTWKVAVNQEIVEGPWKPDSDRYRETSEIVLLPPFAGG